MINATLAALLEREGDQMNIPADELEAQFQALRRLVASKAGFGAFTTLPQYDQLHNSSSALSFYNLI
jgi:DnaJ homolog subfamily C member 13